MRTTLSYIKSLFFRIISSYRVNDKIFIKTINLYFIFMNRRFRFKLSKLGPSYPKYKIVDNKSQIEKFFGFRKQGLMAFANGIEQRGYDIGNAYLLNEIDFKDGDLIFDIGANTGDLKIYFDNKNIKIEYYGFEPGKIEFASLKKNNTDHNVFNIALGDKNHILPFYYHPEYGDSSLVKMRGYSEKYNVNVIKLSSFIKNQNLTNTKLKLIKLEAEGYEPEILKGLDMYLENIEYISADLGFERGINQTSTYPQAKKFLLKRNFKIVSINGHRKVVLFKNLNLKN